MHGNVQKKGKKPKPTKLQETRDVRLKELKNEVHLHQDIVR